MCTQYTAPPPAIYIRVFAIYLIMLGWKAYKHSFEILWNRRTPQPRANPTQKKMG